MTSPSFFFENDVIFEMTSQTLQILFVGLFLDTGVVVVVLFLAIFET